MFFSRTLLSCQSCRRFSVKWLFKILLIVRLLRNRLPKFFQLGNLEIFTVTFAVYKVHNRSLLTKGALDYSSLVSLQRLAISSWTYPHHGIHMMAISINRFTYSTPHQWKSKSWSMSGVHIMNFSVRWTQSNFLKSSIRILQTLKFWSSDSNAWYQVDISRVSLMFKRKFCFRIVDWEAIKVFFIEKFIELHFLISF